MWTAFVHAKDGTSGSEQSYAITHESGTSGLTQHTEARVSEPSGSPSPAMKEWIFGTAGGVAGMVTRHNVYTMPSVTNKFRADTTWTVDGYGKPYISETNTTYDLGQSYAASKRVTQTQDEWGNLTNMKWGIDMWRCIRTTWPGRC